MGGDTDVASLVLRESVARRGERDPRSLPPRGEARPPRDAYRRHHYLDERPTDERGNDVRQEEPMAAFAVLALAGGRFTARPFVLGADDAAFQKKERRYSASYHGFDVHCGVRVGKDDDGRERLVRYCARPPFALDRVELLKDGRIA